MKLFDNLEAFLYPQENKILISTGFWYYYAYEIDKDCWSKHNDRIQNSYSAANYLEITENDLIKAMNGHFPDKETDFLRLCPPSQLTTRDLIDLLKEDYGLYLSNYQIFTSIRRFFALSSERHKSYEEIKNLFNKALNLNLDIIETKKLCKEFLGDDIFKEEIKLTYLDEKEDTSSCFWIMPVKIIDYTDTNDSDNVADIRPLTLIIEKRDVYVYLSPFLLKHFNYELEANINRFDYYFKNKKDNPQMVYLIGFCWHAAHNFYSFDSINNFVQDIRETVEALSTGKENEFVCLLRENGALTTDLELILDFYDKLIGFILYIAKEGNKFGYNLISFMSP